jgi:hypothetical protein
MDICFIKPQDLLALSIAIYACASSRINGLHGLKFSASAQNIDTEDEEAKKLQSQTYWRKVKPDHDPMTHQHAQAGSQKKGKDSISETKSSTTFHKG